MFLPQWWQLGLFQLECQPFCHSPPLLMWPPKPFHVSPLKLRHRQLEHCPSRDLLHHPKEPETPFRSSALFLSLLLPKPTRSQENPPFSLSPWKVVILLASLRRKKLRAPKLLNYRSSNGSALRLL